MIILQPIYSDRKYIIMSDYIEVYGFLFREDMFADATGTSYDK